MKNRRRIIFVSCCYKGGREAEYESAWEGEGNPLPLHSSKDNESKPNKGKVK